MLDPFSTIVNITQIVDVSARVLDGLCSYLAKVKNAPAESHELQKELSVLSRALKNLESVAQCLDKNVPIDPALNEFVRPLNSLLEEMESRLLSKRKITFKRLKWPFTEKENREYLSQMERYKSTLTLTLITMQKCTNFYELLT
jgi:hypothetical protein